MQTEAKTAPFSEDESSSRDVGTCFLPLLSKPVVKLCDFEFWGILVMAMNSVYLIPLCLHKAWSPCPRKSILTVCVATFTTLHGPSGRMRPWGIRYCMFPDPNFFMCLKNGKVIYHKKYELNAWKSSWKFMMAHFPNLPGVGNSEIWNGDFRRSNGDFWRSNGDFRRNLFFWKIPNTQQLEMTPWNSIAWLDYKLQIGIEEMRKERLAHSRAILVW